MIREPLIPDRERLTRSNFLRRDDCRLIRCRVLVFLTGQVPAPVDTNE